MTTEERAIIMAYTGVCMLTGSKMQAFDKYVEKLIGRPVYTHELPALADEIKKKSYGDFIKLCEGD